LGRAAIFAEFDDADIATLEQRVIARGLPAGARVYRQGEHAMALYIVAAGTIKLSRSSGSGLDVTLSVLGAGEGFGPLGVADCATYPDTAWTMTRSCVLEVPVGVFRHFLQHHRHLVYSVLDEVLQRYECAQQTIRRLSTDTARQRIAAQLIELTGILCPGPDHAATPDIPITRADLAALTGVAPETASRIISGLRADGIVDTGRCWTRILDKARLSAIAGQ
jgi:CRP/FNR family transcriptional regulator